jgi:hypothetical protein
VPQPASSAPPTWPAARRSRRGRVACFACFPRHVRRAILSLTQARSPALDPDKSIREQSVTLGWIGAHGGEGITSGQVVRARAVWIDLDVAFPLPLNHRRRVVADGLDLTGRVAGTLKRWVRGSRGEWYGVVWVPLRDGAGDVRLTLDDQLIPAAALSPRPAPGSAWGQSHAVVADSMPDYPGG